MYDTSFNPQCPIPAEETNSRYMLVDNHRIISEKTRLQYKDMITDRRAEVSFKIARQMSLPHELEMQ